VATKRKNPPPIVEVVWHDVVVTTTGWESNKLNKPEVAECRTVGYVIYRDADWIVLVSSWSSDERIAKTTIPRGVVKAIMELRK